MKYGLFPVDQSVGSGIPRNHPRRRIHVLIYDLWIVPVFTSRSFIATNFIDGNKKIELIKHFFPFHNKFIFGEIYYLLIVQRN